ncbi:hypothetical protein ACF0H5_012468 [Mactra antiquata]
MEFGIMFNRQSTMFLVFAICWIVGGYGNTIKTDNLRDYEGTNEISQPSNMFELSNNNKYRHKRSTGLADIARFIDQSNTMISVYVDDTMKRLIFTVKVKRSNPVMSITLPSGSPASIRPVLHGHASLGETVTATIDISINATDYGFWKFIKLDLNTWNVTIQGESVISIKQELLDITTGTLITAPVVGSEYKLLIHVAGFSSVKAVIFGMLFSPSKLMPLTSFGLTVSKGNGDYEVAKLKMPAECLKLCTLTICVFKTKQPLLKFKLGATVFEYSTFTIHYTVTNLLSTIQDIDIRVSDPRGFSQPPTTLGATLKPGENTSGVFNIKSTFAGLSTLVKITAFQRYGPGNFSSGPIEYRNITVIKNESTTTSITAPTSATTLSSTLSSSSPIKTSLSSATSVRTSSPGSSTSGNPALNSSPGSSSTTSILSTVSSSSKSSATSSHTVSSSLTSTTSSSGNSTRPNVSVTKAVTTSQSSNTPGSGHTTHMSVTSSSHSGSTGSSLNTNQPNGGKVTRVSPTSMPTSTQTTTVPKTSVSGISSSQTKSNKDSENTGLSDGIIAACMVTGGVVGMAAIATMAIIFNKALSKKKRQVAPDDGNVETNERKRTISWT